MKLLRRNAAAGGETLTTPLASPGSAGGGDTQPPSVTYREDLAETARRQAEAAGGAEAGGAEARAEARPKGRAREGVHPAVAFGQENWRFLSALAMLAAGVVMVVLGWYGAAHTNIFTEQIPYLISGGLLGLGLIIVAGFLAYAATAERGMEDLRRDVTRLADAIREGGLGSPSGSAAAATRPPAGRVFVVPGGQSFHFGGCPIVEGKQGVESLAPAEALAAGYGSCKLCGPD